MFPPLWGSDSFNRRAGMNKIRRAARYIKANMPLGAGYTLKDMEAWDVPPTCGSTTGRSIPGWVGF